MPVADDEPEIAVVGEDPPPLAPESRRELPRVTLGPRAPGALFVAYLGLYSLGRFFTEALRTDALMLGPIRIAQLVSVVGVGAALAGVPLLLRRSRAS